MTARPAPALPLPPMALFAFATLMPAGVLAAGLAGAVWPWAGLLWMTLLVAMLDQLARGTLQEDGAEFPGSDVLLVTIAAVHLALLPYAVWSLGGPLSGWAAVALFVGLGLWMGQVAVPAAHELIHRGDRRLFWLGVAVYTAILFGHHASAHRLVHHRHAASAKDPNTARAGESYYRFAPRAWIGSFRAGWNAERGRRGLHPYAVYLGGAALALALAFGLAGWAGVAVWLGLSLHAQGQLLLSDYVQHYGLTRSRGPDGRLEPVGHRHSWNAPHWFSGAMTLNAPRHSDHHAHPARPFPALRLPGPRDAPRLPCALPLACTVALIPPLWQRMMHPRLARWQA
jgi:alkane 1-monooxygenase